MNYRRAAYVLLSVLGFLLAACAEKPATYRTESHAGYTFSINQKWTTEREQGDPLYVDPADGYLTVIYVSAVENNDHERMERALLGLEENLRGVKPQYAGLRREVLTNLGGVPYGILEYRYHKDNIDYREWQILIDLQNGKRLMAVGITTPDLWPKQQKNFLTFLDSIRKK